MTGLRGGAVAAGQRGRRNPAPAHGLGQHRIGQQRATAGAGRRELGHDAITVRHQNRFAVCHQAHVFAQLVLERFQADSTHPTKVATGSYFVKGGAPATMRGAEVIIRRAHEVFE